MNKKRKVSTFKQNVLKAKRRLAKNGGFVQWAKDNGYPITKVYNVTGRKEAPEYGYGYEIALKLGLVKPEEENLGEPS